LVSSYATKQQAPLRLVKEKRHEFTNYVVPLDFWQIYLPVRPVKLG